MSSHPEGASTARLSLRYLGALAIVGLASLGADVFSRMTGTSRLTSIFLSSVLLVAFFLGAGPGYLAAIAALLAHLYLVDPPYKFSLGSVDELNAMLLFLAASVLTCLLAGRVRAERFAARARARANAALLAAARELSATADEDFIRLRLAYWLHALAGAPALVLDGASRTAEPHLAVTPQDWEAAEAAQAGAITGVAPDQDDWRFRDLRAGDQAFGLVGWRVGAGQLDREDRAALELLADTGAAAIARARLAAAKTEAEARARTEDLRNALLASVSHDLRTPLAAIMGAAGSLNRFADVFEVETRRDLAATIEEEARRLDAFVSNLLQMTRLQSGAMSLEHIAFDLTEAVHLTLERRAGAALGRIALAADPALPEAIGDPVLFEQALGNVIDNALRYAPEAIAVSVWRAGPGLCVSVEDQGPGVPAADLERIFEKFFRSAAAHRTSGTGLGLAIARGLMEGMGGSIAARPAPGGGLAIDLQLPGAGP
jgi:two-component system sensor histidine kinase KdpD